MLCDNGGALVFTNFCNSGKKVTIDIEGSTNLRIDDGDTFLKKMITVRGDESQGFVIFRLLS